MGQLECSVFPGFPCLLRRKLLLFRDYCNWWMRTICFVGLTLICRSRTLFRFVKLPCAESEPGDIRKSPLFWQCWLLERWWCFSDKCAFPPERKAEGTQKFVFLSLSSLLLGWKSTMILEWNLNSQPRPIGSFGFWEGVFPFGRNPSQTGGHPSECEPLFLSCKYSSYVAVISIKPNFSYRTLYGQLL